MNKEEKETIEYFEHKIKNKLPLYEDTYIDGKLYRRNILQLETSFTEEQANKTEILLNYIDKLQKENEKLTNELSKTQCDNRQLEIELEKANKQMDLDYVDNNFISKDKIKEIAQEYKPNQSNTFIESQERYIKLVEKLELLGE